MDQQQIHRQGFAEARLVGSGINLPRGSTGCDLGLRGTDHQSHYCSIVQQLIGTGAAPGPCILDSIQRSLHAF